MKTSPSSVDHAAFCQPRPDETEPRMESYSAPRYAADGITITGSAWIERCQECGNRSVDGRQVEG